MFYPHVLHGYCILIQAEGRARVSILDSYLPPWGIYSKYPPRWCPPASTLELQFYYQVSKRLKQITFSECLAFKSLSPGPLKWINHIVPKTSSTQNGTVNFHVTVNLKEEMAVTAEKGLIAGVDSIADGMRTKGRRNVKISPGSETETWNAQLQKGVKWFNILWPAIRLKTNINT